MGKQSLPLTGLSFILNDNFYVESSDTRMDFLKTGKPCFVGDHLSPTFASGTCHVVDCGGAFR